MRSALGVAVAVMGLAGCPFVPGDGNYRCTTNDNCAALAGTCVNGRCVAGGPFGNGASAAPSSSASPTSLAATSTATSLQASSAAPGSSSSGPAPSSVVAPSSAMTSSSMVMPSSVARSSSAAPASSSAASSSSSMLVVSSSEMQASSSSAGPPVDPCLPDGGVDPTIVGGLTSPCGSCARIFFGQPQGTFDIDGSHRTGSLSPDASATELHFGAPQAITTISSGKRHISLTPGNERLVGGGIAMSLVEHFGRDGGFAASVNLSSPTDNEGYPHLTQDRTGAFACDVDPQVCGFWRRNSIEVPFPQAPVTYFEAVPPWGSRIANGGRNGKTAAMVPTPSGEYVAFAADWEGATCALPSAGNDNLDLWTARAVSAADPSLGFTDYMHHPRASGPAADLPQWLSDNGLTLIFASGGDLYRTTRSSVETDFEAATRLNGLSDSAVVGVSLTMPSQAYLEANSGGFGYLVRDDTPDRWYRFQVCVGAPCP